MEVLLMKIPSAADAVVGHEETCTSPEPMKIDIGREVHKINDLNCSSSPSHGDFVDNKEEGELESAKEENERLKLMLEQIQERYKSLQLRFLETIQQGGTSKSAPEPELVSLSLGISPTNSRKVDEKAIKEQEMKQAADLTLGLESKFRQSRETMSNSSPENSSDEAGGETWRGNKMQKTAKNGDEEVEVGPGHVKRARVSVRARCDTATMNDGCQWRKYGQKIAKGNPCPRAYYRCTVAPGCPVRKQVQRCAEDTSILITTYEGNHNHQLPFSATAMASTTAAAASMLLSGSSTSQPTLNSSPTTTLNGLSFNLHGHPIRPTQFYSPNINSPLFPTVTLDLTSTSTNHFNRNFPKFPSTNLNFSSSESNILSPVWASAYPAYGGKDSQEQFYQNFQEKNQQSLTEALTKAITSDPSLRSVISAAISSMVGCNGKIGDQIRAESFGQDLMQAVSQNLSSQNGKGFNAGNSGYFSGLTSLSPQTGSSKSSSFPFSIFNSTTCLLASDDKERKN